MFHGRFRRFTCPVVMYAHVSTLTCLHPESAEERPGMSDVTPLPGILGLSFDSSCLSPLLLFCQVLLLVIFLQWSILLTFFPENPQTLSAKS